VRCFFSVPAAAGLFLVLAAGFASMAHASTISVVTNRASITETDFINWSVIAGVSNSGDTPVSSTTNASVSFSVAQSNTNPLNCQGSHSCLRYDFTGPDSSTAIRGFDTFSPITLTFGSGFGEVGFEAIARQTTTFFLQVTHGGVQDAPIQFSPNSAGLFLGVQSTANDITQVIMSISGAGFSGVGNGDYDGIDRVSLATAGITATAPEPGTLGLMLFSAALAFGYARMKRQA
jgi:hypothetical protein